MITVPLLAAAAAISITPAHADAGTFSRAYHANRANPIVYVEPGVYPAQSISGGGRPVVFVGRGRVRVGEIKIEGASHVEFRNMRIDGWSVDDSDHVAFRNVDTHGAFYIDAPSSWISVVGGSVGPSHNADSYIAVPNDSVTRPSQHLLIDGVWFHDVTRSPGRHVECLMLAQGVDVTIRNSVFTRCSVFDVFIDWWYFRPAVGPPTQVRFEHNHFERTTDGYYSLLWAGYVAAAHRTWSAYTLVDNTCDQSADFKDANPRTGFVLRHNPGC